MLPGFGGHLVSEFYLESILADLDDSVAHGTTRLELLKWRTACSWFGPATSVQALLEAAATPLVTALGFDTPSQPFAGPACIVATIRSADRPVALVVTA